MQSKGFRSQLEWRPYGHLICTPVCLLVGTTFLNGMEDLDERAVSKLMGLSHALYRDHFASGGQPLKIQELFSLIPPQLFEYEEAAGLVLSHAQPEAEAEGLLVLSLSRLLCAASERARQTGQPLSLIVTALGHTLCYLAGSNGLIKVFDPLPASLSALPADQDRWLRERYTKQGGPCCETQYSALVLRRKGTDSNIYTTSRTQSRPYDGQVVRPPRAIADGGHCLHPPGV
jgi:hypothetical protein